ncbi:MAG: 8-amino-7-oxononanoate synthase [Planctomycetes bacterium]|nr:8-amino-7-oxononanoate synthase [Planctomycetota bacterium]MBU1518650.1 8-amino-7-oxononanoate synthase [Planctomycetota bacterium]MBU2458130.1 8-amino-7-oxononanoate synthase [Planctomycetota bacterium]MBU2597185.1 8-amino-7-oxononanoate synthase [Planctomycetota bacterium]
MTNFDFIKNELAELKKTDLLRVPVCIDSACDTVIRIANAEKALFCSNNYLNLAGNKQIIAAAKEAMDKFGYGSAASRLISGTIKPHIELENALAKMFNKQAALVFPSGYMTNLAVLQTIPQKGDLILLDKLDHASIIDAAQGSDAEFRTYHRTQFDKIEKFLASEEYNRKFIVTESIFSMDGDFADLKKLVELKKKYNAYLIIDEAHAFGCMGKTGAGLAEELGLLNEIDIIIATLSKSAGCSGGFVASDKCVIDYLVNKARPFIYTTASSVANSAAGLCAVEIIKNAQDKRKRLKQNADYLREKLKTLGLDTGTSTSHIIPVIIGDNKKTLEISKKLFGKGFFVVAIRPPTVAPGTARLRISVQSDHTKEQLDGLVDALRQVLDR